jgi:RNA polymerase sigma-70 factor (ECF subfamily)
VAFYRQMGSIGVASIVLNGSAPETVNEADVSDEALELFRAHRSSLYRFARVVLREPHDAEDVVQSAFVRLLSHLNKGGNRSNLKAWLFTVTANLCRDQLRRRRRWMPWEPAHEQLLTAAPDVHAGDPEALFLATVKTLRPRDRMLLALKAQGLSYRQIAAATGIRETSVGRLLARAMSRWQRARAAMSHA